MNLIQMLNISAVAPSLTNPRKHFDKDALDELTKSIKEHGVLQPILVRPCTYELDGALSFEWRLVKMAPSKNPSHHHTVDSWRPKQKKEDVAKAAFEKVKGITHELVAGERRWRAAQAAGLTEIPAIIRDLDDKAALEVQVIENLQRSDLHPIEEAEGYEALMKSHNYTADDIAAKVGKSKAYVYGRLKLTALCQDARKAMWEGKLSASVALLLARMPNAENQAEALKDVCIDYDGEPVSYRIASREIQQRYMLRLKDAPFSTKDADLVPEAGPCATCRFRTGNQKELFADIANADVCTHPDCFNKKKRAHYEQVIEKAEAKGKQVVRNAFTEYGSLDRQYVDLKSSEYIPGVDAYQPWKKHLGSDCPEVILAVDNHGQVREVVKRADALAVLRQHGKVKGEEAKSDRKAEVRDQKIQALTNYKITAAILDAVQSTKGPDVIMLEDWIWRFLAFGAYQQTDITKHSETAKRRGLAKTQNEARPALQAWLEDDSRTPEDFALLTVELLCLANPWNEDRWVELCRTAGVDQVHLRKLAEAEIDNKPKTQRKTKL